MDHLATSKYVLGVNSKHDCGQGVQSYNEAENLGIFVENNSSKKESIGKATRGHALNKQDQIREAERQSQNSTNATLAVPYEPFLLLTAHSTNNRVIVLSIPFRVGFRASMLKSACASSIMTFGTEMPLPGGEGLGMGVRR